MKDKEYKNILLINLPDYINNTLSDDKLKEKIDFEISNNPEFRTIFEDMKTSLEFIRSSKLDNPPDNYFNNLLPRINEKIARKTEIKSVFGIARILNYWKYALPVFVIATFFFIYNEYFQNHINNIQSENEISSKSTVTNRDVIINNDNTTDTKDDILNDIFDDRENSNSYVLPGNDYFNNSSKYSLNDNSGKEISGNKKGLIGNNPVIADIVNDDDIFDSNDDDYNIDNEFQALTPEQQKQVLTDLKEINLN
jgi:hypothetical protein